MIRVSGPNTGVLNRRMRHHAEKYRPLIDGILYTLWLESWFAHDDEVHWLIQSRTGPGSYGLYTADGKQFHFRPKGDEIAITVLDAYQNGKVIRVLKTEAEARNFIRAISREYGMAMKARATLAVAP